MIYKRIESNQRKTAVLIFFFIVFVVLLGVAFSYLLDFGIFGLIVAILLAVMMSVSGYYNGDKLILRISGAIPASPKKHKQLFNIVEALSIGAGIPTPKIYILPEKAINAFATGRDPQHASIAITEGALMKLNRQELEGVLGHEISHIKNYDIRLMTITSVLVGIVTIIADITFRSFWYGGFRSRDREGDFIGLILFVLGLLLIAFSPIIARIIQFAISRKREFLADADSALLTHNPKGLISALKKIKLENKPLKHSTKATAHLYISNPLPKDYFSKLFMTHPPIEERIKALERL